MFQEPFSLTVLDLKTLSRTLKEVFLPMWQSREPGREKSSILPTGGLKRLAWRNSICLPPWAGKDRA
jgi:hypothetical protein